MPLWPLESTSLVPPLEGREALPRTSCVGSDTGVDAAESRPGAKRFAAWSALSNTYDVVW